MISIGCVQISGKLWCVVELNISHRDLCKQTSNHHIEEVSTSDQPNIIISQTKALLKIASAQHEEIYLWWSVQLCVELHILKT